MADDGAKAMRSDKSSRPKFTLVYRCTRTGERAWQKRDIEVDDDDDDDFAVSGDDEAPTPTWA